MFCRSVKQAGIENGAPFVKVAVGLVVAVLKLSGAHAFGVIGGVPGIKQIPIVGGHSMGLLHLLMKSSSRIGRGDMEGGGGDARFNGPVHGS